MKEQVVRRKVNLLMTNARVLPMPEVFLRCVGLRMDSKSQPPPETKPLKSGMLLRKNWKSQLIEHFCI